MPNNATPLILLTRPEAAARRFADACTDRFGNAARLVVAPLVEIVAVGGDLDLNGVSGLIFTSEAGVAVYAQLSTRRDLPAWCVGDRTAATARSIGLSARSAAGDADTLVAVMGAELPSGQWLHLHGEKTRGEVVDRLCEKGIDAIGHAIYAQRDRTPDEAFMRAITSQTPVIAPLFSPLSAKRFAVALDHQRPDHVTPIALSPAVCATLPADWHAATLVAPAPNADAMLETMARRISP